MDYILEKIGGGRVPLNPPLAFITSYIDTFASEVLMSGVNFSTDTAVSAANFVTGQVKFTAIVSHIVTFLLRQVQRI